MMTNSFTALIGMAGTAIMGFVAIWAIRVKSKSNRDSSASDGSREPKKREKPLSILTSSTIQRNEDRSVERVKMAVHGLLQGVTDNVEGIIEESTRYDHSLNSHSQSIKKATTVAGMRELEDVILDELRDVRSTNAQYRRKLEDVNKKATDQQKELEKLQTDVDTDFLTKIPNRRALQTRFEGEMKRAERYGTKLALAVLDIDHFKSINDQRGHLAGDRILRAMADTLVGNKRSSDYFARYGGEEFVMLLPETDAEQGLKVAENIRKRVAETKFRYEKNTIRVTVSLGVGEVAIGQDTMASFFDRIDAALYKAKERGRNRVELAPAPVDQSASKPPDSRVGRASN